VTALAVAVNAGYLALVWYVVRLYTNELRRRESN